MIFDNIKRILIIYKKIGRHKFEYIKLAQLFIAWPIINTVGDVSEICYYDKMR